MIPYVSIDGIGKEPLTLWYDANAVEMIQERLGVTDLLEISRRCGAMDMKAIKLLWWGGLRRKHPNLTEEEAGAQIDGEHVQLILSKIPEAWARFLGVDPTLNPPVSPLSEPSSNGGNSSAKPSGS